MTSHETRLENEFEHDECLARRGPDDKVNRRDLKQLRERGDGCQQSDHRVRSAHQEGKGNQKRPASEGIHDLRANAFEEQCSQPNLNIAIVNPIRRFYPE